MTATYSWGHEGAERFEAGGETIEETITLAIEESDLEEGQVIEIGRVETPGKLLYAWVGEYLQEQLAKSLYEDWPDLTQEQSDELGQRVQRGIYSYLEEVGEWLPWKVVDLQQHTITRQDLERARAEVSDV
jgi:hypothetical protein